ncbi:hypothetical protein [Phormidium sp. FACHB-1136]|uniref:hypothetical protein n=1 Tax=Phormidium sp. FACHB-1136 TaxID=2692848 RepID=UPI001684C908|nr:hypothetical protein [Phormidium sp. FACHB-1136]MBD2425733.1 hypothetical protein [Phormidium sp. FACHB-1136]
MISTSVGFRWVHCKARIETLVQHCLNAQGQAVAAAEAEIDTIVARLYGLTDAERAIIEGRKG